MSDESYTFRNYSFNDFERYLQLHLESEQLDPSVGFISAQSLSDHLGRPNFTPQKDLFVAEFKGKLVGCLSVTLEFGIQRALLNFLVHPLHRHQRVVTELFRSSVQRIREAEIKTAQISIPETDSDARNMLMKLEFYFIRHFFEMRLDINNIHLPLVQQSVSRSRRLKRGEEALLTEIQNRCFADTWGFNPNTIEEIAYRLNIHGRSPEDVILTYLNNKPVGYCWIIINAEKNAKQEKNKGLIHMLGVDPAYRNQEIGKSILQHGLEDLKHRGVDIVELTVDSKNPAALSLYEGVGFEVYAKTEWYETHI